MSSKRRKAANRANGKKSHGPVTPEGKARSAANAPTRHGLASLDGPSASSVCLTNESRDEFNVLHESLIAEHAPSTTTEHLTVHEMAVARWRLQRAWLMEAALLDNQMDDMRDDLASEHESTDHATRAALAFRELSEKSPSLPALLRYESRLSRQLDRCLKRLSELRLARKKHDLPSEPNPTNEHLNHDQLQHPEPTAAADQAPIQATRIGIAPVEPASSVAKPSSNAS